MMGYMSGVLLKSKVRNDNAYIVLDALKQPLYDNGKPGLVLALYDAFFSTKA
jgi:hypothetical protein